MKFIIKSYFYVTYLIRKLFYNSEVIIYAIKIDLKRPVCLFFFPFVSPSRLLKAHYSTQADNFIYNVICRLLSCSNSSVYIQIQVIFMAAPFNKIRTFSSASFSTHFQRLQPRRFGFSQNFGIPSRFKKQNRDCLNKVWLHRTVTV